MYELDYTIQPPQLLLLLPTEGELLYLITHFTYRPNLLGKWSW